MYNKLLRIIGFITTIIYSMVSNSQTTTIDYLNSGLSTTACNIFNPSVSVGGASHLSHAGGGKFNTTDGVLLTTTPQSVPPGATAYIIQYNFTPGNNYDISITAKGNSAILLKTSVVPNLNQFPTNSTTSCTPDPNVNGYSTVGSGQFSTATTTTSTTYAVPRFSIPGTTAYPYLIIWAAAGSSNLSLDVLSISKVTITKSSAATFTMSPASVNILCGSSTPFTFTVNNVNNTQGVTNHLWNLGSATNGWLYNGSSAPQNISTGTTNTLNLTPVCGGIQSNISVNVTANNINYSTNSSIVSYTQPTLSISGNNTFCSGTEVYTVSGLPCNATVIWSVDPPSGIVNISTNNNQATLTKVGVGQIILTATITACGNQIVRNLSITVGSPSPAITTFEYDPCGTYVSAGAEAIQGATRYIWNLDFRDYITTTPNLYLEQGVEPYPNFHLNAGQHFLRLQVENACGISEYSPSRIFTTQTCGGRLQTLSISPNPARSTLNVATTNNTTFTQIRIFDNTGNLKKQFRYSSPMKKASLDISTLQPGLYRLHAFDGKRWASTSFYKE